MSRLGPLLDEYELSHRHPINIVIHWIAEPLAIFALLALVASVGLLWTFLVCLMAYFGWLSLRVALAFLPIVCGFVAAITLLARHSDLETWVWAGPLFAVSWLTLLLGHRIEGRSPTVFQNPHLVFVGPAWLMRVMFRKFGLRDP